MSKEDLMIGDWVQDSFGNFLNVATHWILSNAKDFEPIPITPEILEKNGFIKYASPGYPEHFSYELPTGHMVFKVFALNNSDFSFNINEHAMRIEYIHELQHILKLCKIDKEIKL